MVIINTLEQRGKMQKTGYVGHPSWGQEPGFDCGRRISHG